MPQRRREVRLGNAGRQEHGPDRLKFCPGPLHCPVETRLADDLGTRPAQTLDDPVEIPFVCVSHQHLLAARKGNGRGQDRNDKLRVGKLTPRQRRSQRQCRANPHDQIRKPQGLD